MKFIRCIILCVIPLAVKAATVEELLAAKYPSGNVHAVVGIQSNTCVNYNGTFADGVTYYDYTRTHGITTCTKLEPDQITDRTSCHQQLAGILMSYGIALPVKPMSAVAQLRTIATTNELARVDMTYALALYTRLRDEYNMSDAQIGGME